MPSCWCSCLLDVCLAESGGKKVRKGRGRPRRGGGGWEGQTGRQTLTHKHTRTCVHTGVQTYCSGYSEPGSTLVLLLGGQKTASPWSDHFRPVFCLFSCLFFLANLHFLITQLVQHVFLLHPQNSELPFVLSSWGRGLSRSPTCLGSEKA